MPIFWWVGVKTVWNNVYNVPVNISNWVYETIGLRGWTWIPSYEDPCFLPLVWSQADKDSNDQPKAWQGLAHITLGSPRRRSCCQPTWGLGIKEREQGAVGTVLSPCLYAQGSRSPASWGCPETHTYGLAPRNSFPGSLLRAWGEQPLRRRPPRSTSVQEARALGLPVRLPAWSTGWSQGTCLRRQ